MNPTRTRKLSPPARSRARSVNALALASLGAVAACRPTTTIVPPPSASLSTEACTDPRCGPEDLVVTVRGAALSGALVTATNIDRPQADGQPFSASTSATSHADVDAGRATMPGQYEIVLRPRATSDGGLTAASRRGDRVRVFQLIDDGVEVDRSNPVDRELTIR